MWLEGSEERASEKAQTIQHEKSSTGVTSVTTCHCLGKNIIEYDLQGSNKTILDIHKQI